jgi:hypothetical protein
VFEYRIKRNGEGGVNRRRMSRFYPVLSNRSKIRRGPAMEAPTGTALKCPHTSNLLVAAQRQEQ